MLKKMGAPRDCKGCKQHTNSRRTAEVAEWNASQRRSYRAGTDTPTKIEDQWMRRGVAKLLAKSVKTGIEEKIWYTVEEMQKVGRKLFLDTEFVFQQSMKQRTRKVCK